jgi:hypothetical protein
MSIRTSLKGLLESLGGTPTANTIPGILGQIVTTLGGTDTGKTIAEKIDCITAKKWADNPLHVVAADVNIAADEDLLGKVVSDLQKDVVVGTDKITGTSKYVTGYTGWSGLPEEQEGNYLALHFGCGDYVIGTSVTINVNGVNLDPDGLHIMRFSGKSAHPKIVVKAIKDGYATFTKVYDCSEIVRQPAS